MNLLKRMFKQLPHLLVLASLVFSNVSCSLFLGNKNGNKTLNIGRSKLDAEFVSELGKEFRKNLKSKTLIQDISGEMALKSLSTGATDVFIGTILIPSSLESSVKKLSIAKDGIVVITNPHNPVNNLSKKQVADVFSGLIRNWKELGGENKPIMVINRDTNSIEKFVFDQQVFNSLPSTTANFLTADSISELKESIKKFPNAISYISHSKISENEALKPLNYDGIPPTSSNIMNGYFPLTRWVYIYYNPEELKESGKFELLKDFANFAHSSKGQSISSSKGLNPLTQAELEIASIENEPYKIGVSASKQGAYVDLGRSIINGAILAVEDFNAAGGIDGKQVELIICDDKSTTSAAVSCAKKFTEEKVLGVVGHLNSQASIEASKIYAQHKIAQITPASTHPWFTERPDSRGYTFRTCGRDDQQAMLIASTIRDLAKPHPLKVTILYNNTIYSSNLSALVEDEIDKYGVDQVVEVKSIEQSQKQYFNELSDMDSQILVYVGEYGDAATLVKALALDNKADVTFFGSDGTFSRQFIEEAGLRSEGSYLVGSASKGNSITQEEFEEKYKNKFKNESSSFATNSYDAAMILLEAINTVRAKNPALIAKEITKSKHIGISGSIEFDEIGDPILPRLAVYKVINQKFSKI